MNTRIIKYQIIPKINVFKVPKDNEIAIVAVEIIDFFYI